MLKHSQSSGLPVDLVACDLDGTLLGPGGTGIDEAKEVAALCRSRGIRFTIATGRAFGSVEKYLRYLELSEPVITNGGAMIAAIESPPLLERTIEPQVASQVAASLREMKLPFYYIAGKSMFTEWDGPETSTYSRNISFDITVVPSLGHLSLAPTQIVVRVDPSEANTLLQDFRTTWSDKVCVIKSLPQLIEFQAMGVSKASALEYLAGIYGIPRERVLAVGDGLNDLEMLSWAGHSACVGNADAEVKSLVGHVCCGFYAEGVMEAVKKTIGE